MTSETLVYDPDAVSTTSLGVAAIGLNNRAMKPRTECRPSSLGITGTTDIEHVDGLVAEDVGDQRAPAVSSSDVED